MDAFDEADANGEDTTGDGNLSKPAGFSDSDKNRSLSRQDRPTGVSRISVEFAGAPVADSDIRLRLPKASENRPINILSLLRKNIGKDLSRISMPVEMNEPLGFLQRFSEDLEYSELLDKANSFASSLDRIMYVAAFAISGYSSSRHRLMRKPFNPLLGETFELVDPTKRLRYIAEKVTHHPHVLATYGESPNFAFSQTLELQTKFWGRSAEFIPVGLNSVRLTATGERFIWNKVTSCLRNIVAGKKFLEHYGIMTIKNVRTRETCVLEFKESGYFTSSQNEVSGHVIDASGAKVRELTGRWDTAFYEKQDEDSLHCLWKTNPDQPDVLENYGFSLFALQLNHLPDKLRPHLPLTDSRFRRDQRYMEEGDFERAEQVKHELEQRQRTMLKQLPKPWEPTWFVSEIDPDAKEPVWRYRGGYFEARASHNFPPPLVSPGA